MRFAIESETPAARQSARWLFSPWLAENTDAPIARRWRLDANGDDSYSVADAGTTYTGDGDAKLNWRERPLVELLTQLEYASLGHFVAHLPSDFVGLHGALLSREFDGERRAVIVVGPKEAGKSTLSCALWRAGWTLHCDDFTLLNARGQAWPTARRVSLRHGSRALMGEELWHSATQTPSARVSDNGVLFHPHEIEGQGRALRR